jgi:hypothetical protein
MRDARVLLGGLRARVPARRQALGTAVRVGRRVGAGLARVRGQWRPDRSLGARAGLQCAGAVGHSAQCARGRGADTRAPVVVVGSPGGRWPHGAGGHRGPGARQFRNRAACVLAGDQRCRRHGRTCPRGAPCRLELSARVRLGLVGQGCVRSGLCAAGPAGRCAGGPGDGLRLRRADVAGAAGARPRPGGSAATIERPACRPWCGTQAWGKSRC